MNGVRDVMRVLVVAKNATTLQTIQRAIAIQAEKVLIATDVAEALAIASTEHPEIAFVDVALEGGAGLALVHHLPAVWPSVAVYALTPAEDLTLGSQALALGAAGMILAPPSGDALLHAVAEVRGRWAEASERKRLTSDLVVAEKRGELLDRMRQLVQQAVKGDRADTAHTIALVLHEASGARGTAVYAATGNNLGSWVRIAAIGQPGPEDLDVASPNRTLLPLVVEERVVGRVAFETPRADVDLAPLAEIAAAALVLSSGPAAPAGDLIHTDDSRVYSLVYFEDTLAREIDKAKRHGRRFSIATLRAGNARGDSEPDERVEKAAAGTAPSRGRSLEDVVFEVVRDTDVLARRNASELLLLMPETGGLGAHACRRRVLARAESEGDERTNQPDRRGDVTPRAARTLSLWMGVATYPHDGLSPSSLLDRARRRADDAHQSPVRLLSLLSKSLTEVIDALMSSPLSSIEGRQPFPLDLSIPSALTVVASACLEASRAGPATIFVTTRPGLNFAQAARFDFAANNSPPTVHEVDLSEAASEEAVAVVLAEHGTWSICGRYEGGRFRGVHSADPLLADLLAQRLAHRGGVRLP